MFSRLIRYRGEAEGALDVLKMQQGIVMLSAGKQEPSPQNREFDAGADQFLGERGCPSLKGRHLTPPDQRQKDVLDQARGPREVGGRQSVGHGVVNQALLLIPVTRAPVEFWYERRVCALQTMAQRFGEELVIAIPPPLLVQW